MPSRQVRYSGHKLMDESVTPRQMAKELLKGVLPCRPLFLPIVFSLGASVENIPLDTFLSNPTKISSSLRQMRGHLRADGVACYFDPYLEVEALGATVQLHPGDQPPTIHWRHSTPRGEVPEGLRSPEEALRGGRVPVAVEVIRRMNSLGNRDFLLMAGVTGPLTLASRITGLDPREKVHGEDVPTSALEFAASVDTQLATAFLEAGADLIVIQEDILPAQTAESYDFWANLLTPTINVIRFYEALPVLQLTDARSVFEHWTTIWHQQWDCVLSLPTAVMTQRHREASLTTAGPLLGICLPLEAFRPEEPGGQADLSSQQPIVCELRHALVTTAGDVPASVDMRRLLRILGQVPRTF